MQENYKILPKKLNVGDTIGIIAPSGVIRDHKALDSTKVFFENKGFKVKFGTHILQRKWCMAGLDDQRVQDLHDFFESPEINAIVCARGGYGTIRILEKLDYTLIKNNPKIFVGYSDITALHSAINKFSNLVTFHGPLALSDFDNNNINDYTIRSFFNLLEAKNSLPIEIENFYDAISIKPGKANGELIGGNLAVLCGLLGSKYFPDLSGKILFLEDVSEYLYRIDRFLQQLKLAGVFSQVKGIIVGEFTAIPENNDDIISGMNTLKLVEELTHDLNIPTLYNFSCGHSKPKTTLPLGVTCELDSTNRKLTILDSFIDI